MSTPTLRAIIYVRSMEDLVYCQTYGAARGYREMGVVLDVEGRRWRDVLEACLAGQCEVIVLRRLEDLPAGRVPRTEIASAIVEQAQDVKRLRRRPKPR